MEEIEIEIHRWTLYISHLYFRIRLIPRGSFGRWKFSPRNIRTNGRCFMLPSIAIPNKCICGYAATILLTELKSLFATSNINANTWIHTPILYLQYTPILFGKVYQLSKDNLVWVRAYSPKGREKERTRHSHKHISFVPFFLSAGNLQTHLTWSQPNSHVSCLSYQNRWLFAQLNRNTATEAAVMP